MHRPSAPVAACLLLLALLAAAPPPELSAQVTDASDWSASRTELLRLAETLERAATSPAYSDRTRSTATTQLAAVRRRLSAGDFAVGERIVVAIRGQATDVRDTLTVQDSLVVVIPNIRRVRLYGVLRAELEELVTREVAEVVRGAAVSATTLMRLAVFGEVGTPGFLSVSAETMLDQLVTRAGGPTAGADFSKATMVRGDTTLLLPAAIQSAIATGRTLATLGLRDGDALVVPPRSARWDRASFLQVAGILIGPMITFLLVR